MISASNYPTIGEVKLLFEVDEMKCVFTNYFNEISEALHVPTFFDLCYKKLAYGDMSQDNILESVRRTSQRHLMNLSATETRNYFRNLIMPSQTSQSVSNKLKLYFNSNSPGDEIVPLE
ncbi:hypothetical protein RCL_jg26361.t1 [Rhizophagus clarus]|uniref:Uncharacterized protein n=1 Tax=Rhizophagus clarus TaxID=94130 RepID=A0A8H3QGX8_9GLOM|nr:hypothetical protein RCL_jg26361.t1 [Rhizophagus clarus]